MIALALIALLLALPAQGAAERRTPRVLTTGDSMVQPLDSQLKRAVSRAGGRLKRDPRPGTGISKPLLLDWPRHAGHQVKRHRPDAVVVFIGANDAEPLRSDDGPEVKCCHRAWVDAYTDRAERMMRAYLRRARTRVYWLTLPAPRRRAWRTRFNAVNLAFRAAAERAGRRVQIVDTIPVLSPGNRYRKKVRYRGRRRAVRDRDGIHLNVAGSKIARDLVVRRMRRSGVLR